MNTANLMLSFKGVSQPGTPITEITVIRQNIGQIIGGFLSWVSIFSAIVLFILIIFPFPSLFMEIS